MIIARASPTQEIKEKLKCKKKKKIILAFFSFYLVAPTRIRIVKMSLIPSQIYSYISLQKIKTNKVF
jgi:hypothetical protein